MRILMSLVRCSGWRNGHRHGRAHWGHGVQFSASPHCARKKGGTSRTRRYGYRLEMQGAKVNSLTELKYYFCTQVSKYVLLPRFFYVINIVAYKMNLSPLVYISAA